MPSKRRNNGRSKKNRGHTTPVTCSNCARLVPKDKAIKRYTIRDIVDASSKRDMKEQSAFKIFSVPKLFIKMQVKFNVY
jgi:small subunit ribosomal protein S26e